LFFPEDSVIVCQSRWRRKIWELIIIHYQPKRGFWRATCICNLSPQYIISNNMANGLGSFSWIIIQQHYFAVRSINHSSIMIKMVWYGSKNLFYCFLLQYFWFINHVQLNKQLKREKNLFATDSKSNGLTCWVTGREVTWYKNYHDLRFT